MSNDEFNIKDFLHAIWNNKLLIILITSIFAYFSVQYSLSLPNIYQSNALLAPNQKKTNTDALRTVARLTGANIKFGDDYNKVDYALALLYSSEFIENFIKKHNIKPEIMAAKSYNKATKKLIYDNRVYDSEMKSWKIPELDEYQKFKKYIYSFFGVNLTNNKVAEPTMQKTVSTFRSYIIINKNKRNGFVNLGIKHVNPILARNWTNLLINTINNDIRKLDIDESRKLISYLEKQISSTSLKELRLIFYELIQKQTEKIMLLKLENSMFKIIDPFIPEDKAEPRRSAICIAITSLGLFISIIIAQIKFFRRKN